MTKNQTHAARKAAIEAKTLRREAEAMGGRAGAARRDEAAQQAKRARRLAGRKGR